VQAHQLSAVIPSLVLATKLGKRCWRTTTVTSKDERAKERAWARAKARARAREWERAVERAKDKEKEKSVNTFVELHLIYFEWPGSSPFVRSLARYFLYLQGKGKGGSDYEGSYYGKGKGGYSGYGSVDGGEGKGMGGYSGYGGYGGAPTFDDDFFNDDSFPQFPFPPPFDDAFFNDDSFPQFPSPPPAMQGPQCFQVAFEESILFLSADLAIPPPTAGPNEIGTTFIYKPSPVFNITDFRDNGSFVELENSQITGVCTRTLEPVGGVGGGGVCQFTIQVEDASFTFGGFIEDLVAGEPDPTLVISGGSGEITGITGEVALLPLDENGDDFTGDIFLDAFGYEATVSAFVLVCEVIDGF
jgi:hypothetical protein